MNLSMLELASLISPEIGIAVVALGVLLLDVTALRGREPARRAHILGLVTAAGLGCVFVGIVQYMSWGVHYTDAALILVIDQLSLGLKALIVAITAGTALIAISYPFTKHVGEFFALTLLASVGMTLLVSTENLLMLFVALELLSVCLYVLTAFHKGLLRSAEGAVKYFMFGALSSAFLLFGLSWVAGATGAMDLRAVAAAAPALQGSSLALLMVGSLFITIGLGFKIAAVPFHFWAPDAYEGAPAPVAAFIATGSKVAAFVIGAKLFWFALPTLAGSALIGFSGTLKLVPGWALALAVVASVSMIWGNAAAIAQKNVKRLLAYSSIAHAGYILVAVVAGGPLGVHAVLFYLFAYALTNLGAFGVVAVLTEAAGGDDVEDFDGMAQRSPLMSLLLLVFILSLAGIPPLAGFFGKFLLFGAAVTADAHDFGLTWLVVIGLATSAVSLYYYLALLKRVFVHAPRAGAVPVSRTAKLTLAALALAVLALGAWPQPLLGFIEQTTSTWLR